ncbi:MAG: hypothetical protein RIS70_3982 [Planctomycetota bacterium]
MLLSPWLNWLLSAGLASCMAILLPRLSRLKAGTTLDGVYGWALFAFLGAVLCDPLGTLLADNDRESLRFAVACLQLCPTMALLGVRKPHHRAWNVVVVSLWLVAVLPAGNAWLGRPLALHPARQWFMLGIMLLGIGNFLPTRFAIPGGLVGTLQLAVIARYLPDTPVAWFGAWSSAGPVSQERLLTAAMFLSGFWLGRGLPARGTFTPLDRVWLDFRDLFGGLWALRVQERVNAVSRQNGWPLTLTWAGLRIERDAESVALNDERQRAVATTMAGILRRFVTVDWMTQRGLKMTGSELASAPDSESLKSIPSRESR